MHHGGSPGRTAPSPGRDGAPGPSPPRGAAALAALTGLGPFPVDMIGGGERMGNTTPPSIALPALAAAQAGLLLRAPCAVAARGPPQPGRHDGLAVAHGARDHRGHRPLPGRDHAATAHRIGAVVDHPAALVRPPDRAGPAHLAALCGRSGRWPACPRARHPRAVVTSAARGWHRRRCGGPRPARDRRVRPGAGIQPWPPWPFSPAASSPLSLPAIHLPKALAELGPPFRHGSRTQADSTQPPGTRRVPQGA